MKLRKRKDKRSPEIRQASRNLPVNNYYRSPKSNTKPSASKDQNIKERGRGLSLSRIINYLLIIAAIGLVVFATTLTTTPKIDLRKDNAKYYELPVYEKAAQEVAKSNILNRSKFLFQEKDFELKMKQKFPEISQVSSLIPLGGRNLTVVISVSEPFAYVTNGTDSGIINNEGVLVTKNNQSVPTDLLKLRFTEPQSNFDVGSRILTTDEITTLALLQNEMNSLQFLDETNASIKDILFNVAQGQIEANLNNKPIYIKLSTFTDAPQQVGGAKATLKELDSKNTLPTKYIDVRVPGRTFVL